MPLDLNVRGCQAQHVDGARLASVARRHRARLHDQCGVSGNLIPVGRVADMTDVEMSGKEHVGAGGRQLSHRHVGPADQVAVAVRLRHIERVVRDHDPDRAVRRRGQPRCLARNLCVIEPSAAMEWHRARAVQTHGNHLVILEDRLEVILDVAAKPAVGIEQSHRQVEERHIVVPGHDEHRERESIEKHARLSELVAPCALREVA